MPAEHKSHILIAVLGFAGVVVTTLSSNWDTWFSQSVPAPVVTPAPLVTSSPPATTTPPEITTPPESATLPASPTPHIIPSPRVTPFPPYTPRPRVTVTPPDATPPPATSALPASPSPRVTASARISPTPLATTPPSAVITPSALTPASVSTTRITSPRDGATVGRRIAVEGMLAGLHPEQHVFMCVKSQAFGRLIYPQGKVVPDATGQWSVDSIYATPGYSYETFLVVTTNAAAATRLSDQHASKYGMRDLPPGTERLGAAIVVTRK